MQVLTFYVASLAANVILIFFYLMLFDIWYMMLFFDFHCFLLLIVYELLSYFNHSISTYNMCFYQSQKLKSKV